MSKTKQRERGRWVTAANATGYLCVDLKNAKAVFEDCGSRKKHPEARVQIWVPSKGRGKK